MLEIFYFLKNQLRNKARHCTCTGQSRNRNCCADLNGRLMAPSMQTLINEHLSLTCSATLQPRKRNSSQGSGGVDRRAGSPGHYRGGGAIKPCSPSLSLPQGPLVLPIKAWESHGCNEVPGTKVAITAQLNCHRRLNGSTSPKCSPGCKYLLIGRKPKRISQCAVASW